MDRTFEFDQMVDAHRYLENNGQFGRSWSRSRPGRSLSNRRGMAGGAGADVGSPYQLVGAGCAHSRRVLFCRKGRYRSTDRTAPDHRHAVPRVRGLCGPIALDASRYPARQFSTKAVNCLALVLASRPVG
ncbi:MAG: hypothetical protein WDN30_09935 [Pararobbsia sp.]